VPSYGKLTPKLRTEVKKRMVFEEDEEWEEGEDEEWEEEEW
jgi:hypothetical protein